MNITETQVVSNAVPPLKRQVLTWAVLKATAGVSKSSGAKQIVLELECQAPDEITGTDKKKYSPAGLKRNIYLQLEGKGLANTQLFFSRLGLQEQFDETNSEEVKQVFDGLGFRSVESTREAFLSESDPVTGEDKAILDDNGQKISKGYEFGFFNASDIINRVSVEV